MPGSTSFPTAIDSFVNPNSAAGDTLASVPHDAQHGSANLAIEALETKVGINGSADATSIDYKLTQLLGVSSAPTMANPSISNNTSTTILAAATYKYIEIQNNSNTLVAISLSGAALTSTTPSSSNPCFTLEPGQVWRATSPPWTPSTAITAYQSSGSTISSVSVASA